MARSLVTCTEGQWTKVATNILIGMLRLPVQSGAFKFTYTTRDTGDTAPSNSDETDAGLALPLFEDSRDVEINSSTGLDIYLWVQNSDNDKVDIVDVMLET